MRHSAPTRVSPAGGPREAGGPQAPCLSREQVAAGSWLSRALPDENQPSVSPRDADSASFNRFGFDHGPDWQSAGRGPAFASDDQVRLEQWPIRNPTRVSAPRGGRWKINDAGGYAHRLGALPRACCGRLLVALFAFGAPPRISKAERAMRASWLDADAGHSKGYSLALNS